MEIAGTVVDAATGLPLVKATISADGTPVGVTDGNGQFDIMLSTAASMSEISYVGYNGISMTPAQINDANNLTLNYAVKILPDVTVTAQALAAKANYTLLMIGAAGIGVLALLGKGKKKISGISTTTILLAGGGLVAAYLIYSSMQAK